jgi:Subtilase family
VTGADGTSDLFTLAKGIQAAVDAGAQVINISLGAYQNSPVLTQAIDYASARGAVIVAAAGNDQASKLTWPAADPRVVSVGSVDALEQQAGFSNSGTGLKLTAPGLDLYTAGADGSRVSFSGTSGSAPIVAGSIAAMMSQNAGMTAVQAWEVLSYYSNDGGAPGADAAYGSGILNLGWAMNRYEPARVDTAVSSHYFNNKTGQMEFVVQNRSGAAVNGMTLYLTDSMGQTVWNIPPLSPGGTSTVTVPVNQLELSRSADGLYYRSQLINPANVQDVVPGNNQKASTVSKPR